MSFLKPCYYNYSARHAYKMYKIMLKVKEIFKIILCNIYVIIGQGLHYIRIKNKNIPNLVFRIPYNITVIINVIDAESERSNPKQLLSAMHKYACLNNQARNMLTWIFLSCSDLQKKIKRSECFLDLNG